ncbi:MAG: putative toxin-antitoxin system toxin component, PIN family [Anaerolineae bacterium]|nr:putative toxin-antitoxin system toxin component, PIN family [Anaerolineae bacterium]
MISEAEFITISSSVRICRDPKDDKFLELAVNGMADYLISGDDDLLDLNPFEGISIVSPREFLDRMQSSPS